MVSVIFLVCLFAASLNANVDSVKHLDNINNNINNSANNISDIDNNISNIANNISNIGNNISNITNNIGNINNTSNEDNAFTVNNSLPTDLHWAVVVVLIIGISCLVLGTGRWFCAVGRGRLLCVVRPTTPVQTTADQEIVNALDQDERVF
jgi:predicted PurR-regulated permease PerM